MTQVEWSKSFWSAHADREFLKGEGVLFKDVKINEYNGARNITNTFQTKIIRYSDDPNMISLMPEYNELKNYYDSHPLDETPQPGLDYSFLGYQFKTLEQVELESKDTIKSPNDKVYNDIIAWVYLIKQDMMYYISCPSDKCTKKVIEEAGMFRCEACRNVYSKVAQSKIHSQRENLRLHNEHMDCF